MTNELPAISNCTYTSNSSFCGNLYAGDPVFGTTTGPAFTYTQSPLAEEAFKQAWQQTQDLELIRNNMPNETAAKRRIVQVFIADPNENVPLDHSLLYQDDKPHLTDLTDQELFFDLDIKSILEKHNEYRVTVVDKDASEGKNKDIMLEPAKVRDLRMTVVNVATF
jgi:hypothetical protein